jgi:anti-sigma regulatory factor (Ser/Thr protein kinase)
VTLELQATPEEVMRAVASLEEFGRAKQVPEKTLSRLAVALEECGSNIVNHALQRDPSRKFQVIFEHTKSAVTIELRDHGPEFDPTRPPTKAPIPNDDDRPPGGWGIGLVQRFVDKIRYRREAGVNILHLTKGLAEATDLE